MGFGIQRVGKGPLVIEITLVGQSASISATTLYSVLANEAGIYKIHYSLKTTTAAITSSSIAFQCRYTDATDSQIVTIPSNSINGLHQTNTNSVTTGQISGDFLIHAKGASNIEYIITVTSNPVGELRYKAYFAVEKY